MVFSRPEQKLPGQNGFHLEKGYILTVFEVKVFLRPFAWQYTWRCSSNVITLSSNAGCGVIPVQTGIQSFYAILDPGFRRGDGTIDHFSLNVNDIGCSSVLTADGLPCSRSPAPLAFGDVVIIYMK